MDLEIIIPIIVVAVIAFVIYKKKKSAPVSTDAEFTGGGKPSEGGKQQLK